jgi:protein phosphatase-4 regulatory subunit 3
MQDEFYVKHMVDKQVLGPILDVLLRTLPRDNLLSSACLELFMLVNKENIKELIKQMVENYREKVMALAYIDTFNEILNRYDQTQGFTTNIDPYFESEDELGRARPTNGAARAMMEHIAVDQAQEDYWNTSDDEDDLAGHEPSEEELRRTLGMMPDRSPSKPLVEYNSDEEADENDAVMTPVDAHASTTSPTSDDNNQPAPTATGTATPTNGTPQTPPSSKQAASTSTPTSASAAAAAAAATSAAPPERLSEKRRREEDEDDDVLDKLTQQHKRRNSSSAASNASSVGSVGGVLLRKKRSFGGQGQGQGGSGSPNGVGAGTAGGGGGGGGQGRKIAISLSSGAVKAAPAVAAGGGDEGGGRGGGGGEGGK